MIDRIVESWDDYLKKYSSKEDLLEVGYDVDKIAKNFNPIVTKVEDNGDHFSLYLVDKKSKIGLWVDCTYDDEGLVTWDWNKFIVTRTDSKDMLIEYLQEEENVWNSCDSEIEDWCYENEKYYRESRKSSKKSVCKLLNESKATDIMHQCERILNKYGAEWKGSSVEVIDGITYIVFKYYGGTNDTSDRNDDSWSKMYELDGVVDVGYGYGYGMQDKYEDSLLIQIDDAV